MVLVTALVSCLVALPASASVSRGYAPPFHWGVDLAVAAGTGVRSIEPGVVSFAGSVAGNRAVTVETSSGVLVTVSFLSFLSVGAGNSVAAGGLLGFSGFAHGSPGVHVSVRRDGVYTDPGPWLRCRDGGPGHLRLLPPIPAWTYPWARATSASWRDIRPASPGPSHRWRGGL